MLGVVLTIGFRDSYGYGMSNGMAGFLLGILLLVIGVFGILGSRDQTITIDPSERVITVEDMSFFGNRQRVIPFDEVVSVNIGYLGKRSNLTKIYFLNLKLTSGKKYPLFAPGRFYPGATDRSVVEGWKERLELYLSHSHSLS